MSATTNASSYSHLDTYLPSQTAPIALRVLKPEDAAAFAALLSEPAGKLDTAWAAPVIERMCASAAEPTIMVDGRVASGPSRVNLAIVSTDPDAKKEDFIGLGGFGAIKTRADGTRAGDVGIQLVPSAQGKGYAPEALRLAMDWAATRAEKGGLQLDIISSTTLEDNRKMLDLAHKIGFTRSERRQAEFGSSNIEVYFEMSAEEWRHLRAAST